MKKFLNITHSELQDLQVKSFQELWEKTKGEYEGFSCELPFTFEKTITKGADDKDEEVYIMVASDDKEDRHGDIVLQNWIIGKNIPLIDSHNYSSITHILGTFSKGKADEHKLRGVLKFSKANPKGQLAKEMVDEDSLVYSSVGFIPKEFDDKGRITKSELLEVSMVSVPANPRAMLEKKEVKVEEKQEEVTPEEKPVIIETAVVIDKNKVILNSIARSVNEMDSRNMSKKKREIFKALRSL